jgi:putative flippase GtrA
MLGLIKKEETKKLLLYLLRWETSSPILALVLYLLHTNELLETIVANLIGGLIFFWVDRKIFKGE